MIIEELSIDAHPTIETVAEILESTHATETTVRTVVWAFIVGHP